MSSEKNSNRKERNFACCSFDGISEMMKDCFPDDAGYSECLARMKEKQDKHCSQKSDDAASEDRKGCCG
ncbi:MAG: hypothetical protein JSW69_01005 [Deltaproteobacteria bacterium]|nr:MAG: hypothetical protein JSW69_01005 [Deltaproteobacteria bacterium]